MALTRSLRAFTDPAVPLDTKAIEEIGEYDPILKEWGIAARVADAQARATDQGTNVEALLAANSAAIPYTVGTYTGRATATGVVGIDDGTIARVYEFVAAAGDIAVPTNIPVIIGTTNDTDWAAFAAKVNDAGWQGANRQNVVAVHVAGSDKVYLYPADAPGGTPVAGVSGLTVTETTDNFTLLRTALDDTPGSVVPNTKHADFPYTVVAGSLSAAQPIAIPLAFDPKTWMTQVRDAAGVLQPDAYVGVTVPAAVGTQHFLGLTFTPTAPTSLKREVIELPLGAGGIATHFEWNPPRGVVPVGYKFSRGAALVGATLTVALDRITKATGAVETALSTAVTVAGGVEDVEQVFTPSTAIAGHAISAAQGLKVTLKPDATATAPGSVTFIVEYYEPVIATDVVHVFVSGV